jgi:hypothetical protein
VHYPKAPTFRLGLFSLIFDGGVVVGDSDSNRLYVQNAAAGAIWTLLQAGLTTREAVSVLSRSFGLSEQVGLSHIRTILDAWDRLGLVGISPASADKLSVLAAKPAIVASAEAMGTFLIGGLAFSIQTDNRDVAAHIFAALRSLRADAIPSHSISATRTADGNSIGLQIDGIERLQVDNPAEMIGAIFQTMLELIRDDNSWLALIHGAAVASGSAGILLSGASGSGKSTLAAYLSAKGFKYLSDDLIVLSKPSGEIVPWPVPHSLKRGSWQTLEHLFPQIVDAKIERIGGREMKFVAAPVNSWSNVGITAQLLIFPRYDSSGSMTVTRIAPLLALQRLIEDRIWLGNPIEKSSVEAFLRVLETIPAYILQYSNLEQAEESIRALIEAPSLNRSQPAQ